MIEILEKLFGSAAKVKIMRLFLFNPGETFHLDEVVHRSKVTPADARYEIALLEKVGMIKKRSFFKDHVVGKGKKKKIERVRTTGWTIDETFDYLDPLQSLLIQVSPFRNAELLKKFARIGKLKLVIVAGVFIQNWDSRVDLLIVGDSIKKGMLENIIKTIEAELGREITYTSFETADFQYRFSMYDKLIRDILDYPHEKILDRVGIPIK
jgi:hypothetical protein